MAFSIRSFFGKEKGSDAPAPGSPPNSGSALPPLGANPFQPAPAKPFAASAAHTAADPTSAPMDSPFTPFTPAGSGRTELTVGDILPGLPPEALNNRQVPLNQPLHLADEIIERALASGQAALPLFEIYRVCPALFPTPISPEDKRAVPIPPHKIASLIPKSGSPQAPAGGASPFAIAPPGSAPGFPNGPISSSLFSPFVEVDQPGEPDSPATLFHPSPFNFGAPSGDTQRVPVQPPTPPQAQVPPTSPFGMAGAGPETQPGAIAPGMPNPFAPTSAATFASMAFGSTGPAPANAPGHGAPEGGSPFSLGAPPQPPAPPAPRSEAAPLASPFSGAAPAPAAPFDFASPAKPTAEVPGQASPFAAASPAPSHGSVPPNPMWPGARPLPPGPSAPSTATGAVPLHSPFAPEPGSAPPSVPLQSPFSPSGPAMPGQPGPQAFPSQATGGAPSWMPTPAKPGMGASPFAGFAVPAPAPPAPLAALPPEEQKAVAPPAEVPASPPAEPPTPTKNEATPPVAGMPAFPGFSPTPAYGLGPTAPGAAPAESSFPPLRPGPFSPAPELFRPAQPPQAPPAPGGMNPFERIQALSRVEAPPSTHPSEAPAAPVAAERAQAPAPASPASPPVSAAAPPVNQVPPATPTPQELGPISSAVFAPAPELRPMPHVPAQVQGHGQAPAPVEKVALSLASVLKSCKTHELGMSPDHIPSWVRVNLPLDVIRPQLLTGKVTLRVTQVMAALEPELRNLITPSRPDLSVDLPMNELRKALPNEPFPEPSAPASQPMSGTATQAPAIPSLFQAATPGDTTGPSLTDNAWPLPPGTPDPESAPTESAELNTAFSFLQDEPEVLEAVAPAPAVQEPVVDVTPRPTEGAAAAAPVSAKSELIPAPKPVRPATPPTNESTGITKSAIRVIPPTPASQSASQMLLRALLNTDEPLDTPTAVQLLSCQPGIVAVTCLRDGTCLAAAGNGSAEAEHFLNQAPKLHHHIQPLVVLTGSLDTETFSMNSGSLLITFSLQSEITLGVLHDPRTQGPALRDRIILISRELSPLLNLPAA